MSELKVFVCKHCGALVESLVTAGSLTCCGEKMTELTANTVDAAKEKHVPEVTREGNHLKVQVGSVLHPMEEKHYIQFVIVKQGKRTQRVDFAPGETPAAEFNIADGPAAVYEYCNLHGLWKAEC